MSDRTCGIDGCERTLYAVALCSAHYHRRWRTGRIGPPEVRSGKRACEVEGCERPHFGRGYCTMHYARFRTHGDPGMVLPHFVPPTSTGAGNPMWVGDNANYKTVHSRLAHTRGPARLAVCACGRQAEQWSYDHCDPNQKQSESGVFSTDLSHYVARCTSCHKRFDLDVAASL